MECSSSGCDIGSDYLASIVTKYSEKILLTESDTKPRGSRQKNRSFLPMLDAKIRWISVLNGRVPLHGIAPLVEMGTQSSYVI
jgi:hypothetical protein